MLAVTITLLLNSCFCCSSASCTSNIWRRFSSRRVAGETCSNTSVWGTILQHAQCCISYILPTPAIERTTTQPNRAGNRTSSAAPAQGADESPW